MAEKPQTMGERMAVVETWMTQHEITCGNRFTLQMWVLGILLSILIGTCAWGLNKVFDSQQKQLELLQARAEARR